MRTYKKMWFVSGLFMLLLINSNGSAAHYMRIPMIEQKGSNTCWTACIRMVLASFGTYVTEEDVHNIAFPGIGWQNVKNELIGSFPSVERLLWEKWNIPVEPALGRYSQPLLTSYINLNLPIIAGLKGKGRSDHAVVITGYTGSGGLNVGDVRFNDPEVTPSTPYGQVYDIPYSQFVDNILFSWDQSLRMLRYVTYDNSWRDNIRNASSGTTITVPPGPYVIDQNINVLETSENVVLSLQPGTGLYFTAGASTIWVGSTGQITGADNIKLSHDIRVYNTPYPREPEPEDNLIGLFSNLCDALYYGRYGKTVVVGPGVYSYNFRVSNQGFIGTIDPLAPKDSTKSAIFRVGFDYSAPQCGYPPAEERPDIITLIKRRQLEINGDNLSDNSSALITFGDEVSIYEDCIYEAVYSDPSNKKGTALQLGREDYPLTGKVSFTNCTFRNFGTAIYADHPMLPEQSPVFVNTIFENNGTDLRFNENSRAFCGLEANQIKSVLVGQVKHTGETSINNLVSGNCGSSAAMLSRNLSVADPGFVDPLVSDFRLTSISPLRAAGTGLKDIGSNSMDAVFTFSSFLNARVEFDNGQIAQFENGEFTMNTVGDYAAFRFRYAKNLRPVYELKFRGGFINKPSTVTVWKNSKVSAPSLPNEYVVWDASVNGVQFVKMAYAELLSSGFVTKTAVPRTIAPAPVSGINTVNDNNDVVIRWNRNTEPDMARYKIFRAPAAAPHDMSQIASLPADVTEYKDVNRRKADNTYSIVAYDSTGNMSAHISSGNKIYSFSGFDASLRDTLRVTPCGITVQINNPDYMHGAMITIRNRGQNDSLIVDWYGVRDQNHQDCGSRSAPLFGNGAQINNIASPKLGNGSALFNMRSATNETYLIDVEIFNWRNGYGCW
ncbi:MAG: hypothetical protein LBI42_15525 [Chitinispirillales bacterium]|jgi:hypothetical protein|nr:hypothetical protein [Chitinispirillales bacterium]